MKKLGTLGWVTLLAVLLVTVTGLSLAQETPDAAGPYLLQHEAGSEQLQATPLTAGKIRESAVQNATRFESTGLNMQLPVNRSYVRNDIDDEACFQLLANPLLNVVEFGDGQGVAEPWVILDPIVYYSTIDFVSPSYSLIFLDADSGDDSPGIDSLAQGFFMPDDLTYVVVDYSTATLSTNDTDTAHGNIYSLDENGNLDEFLFGWDINNSDGQWQDRFVEILGQVTLDEMQGKPLAIIFFSLTDGGAPAEEVFFDDITLIACVEVAPPPGSGTVFMPNIMDNFGKASGPICAPPTENPQDEYNKNRGMVQTGSTCRSSLSNIDRADYYAFTPTQSGNHTLRLTNLPNGTEWAAMMFFDTDSPSYVPGPTSGDCRIGVGGSGDKSVTCSLQKDVPLIVKVSAGSTPVQGDYTMRITR